MRWLPTHSVNCTSICKRKKAARSTAPGVTYAENWSGYNTATDYYNAFNKGKLSGYVANKTPSQGSTFTNAFEIVSDATKAATGKAFRVYMGKNGNGSSGTIDNQQFTIPFSGDATKVTGAYPTGSYLTSFYIQVQVWMDTYIDYFWRLGDGSVATDPKIFRLDTWYQTNNGEIVPSNHGNLGFVTCYRRLGTPDGQGNSAGSNPLYWKSRNTANYSPNFQYQPAIDNGTPANPTTEAQFKDRYGPMNYGMVSGTSQASLLHTQANTPDPDAAKGGNPWARAQLNVIEIWVDLQSQSLKLWHAVRGGAPRLLINSQGDSFFGNRVMLDNVGNVDGTGWSIIQLTPLVYTADGTNNPGYPISWIDYSELIVSTNPIMFPGGFALT